MLPLKIGKKERPETTGQSFSPPCLGIGVDAPTKYAKIHGKQRDWCQPKWLH